MFSVVSQSYVSHSSQAVSNIQPMKLYYDFCQSDRPLGSIYIGATQSLHSFYQGIRTVSGRDRNVS